MSLQVQTFTSLTEVVSRLGAQSSGSNYTVYGLNLTQEAMQAHVDRANKYVSSLVPDLLEGSVDPRLPSAELAASDLACLGILVTSVGGALVGAYDYFLGDMRVARSGPYASAIKTAIEGYKQSVENNLTNVTSPIASSNARLEEEVPRQNTSPRPYGWPLS